MSRFPLLVVLAPAALAGGCAAAGPFPSLAPRPIERLAEQSAPIAAAVPADPELTRSIAALAEEARASAAAFAAALPGAEAAVRDAGAVESERWILAQQQVSRLEAARARIAAALTGLDVLTSDRAGLPLAAADIAALTAARAEADALGAGQQEAIDRLRAALL